MPKMAPLWLSLLALFAVENSAYNLETRDCTVQKAPGKTPAMFGFSVAAHKERGHAWMMVGAPKAQSFLREDIKNGGVVYRCEPDKDNACVEVSFDKSNNTTYPPTENKSDQWFGATISSGGEDTPFVACAPRYVALGAQGDRRDPVGTCFVAKNGFSEILEYAPCRTRQYGYHRQGYCQAGLGAAISSDGRRLFIGAPGSWYWQGQIYSQSMDTRKDVINTLESGAKFDNSYLGYSVATGYFNGNNEQAVAVGMPRGDNLKGKVVLYTADVKNILNVTGEQTGEYFGYSICSCDVNGDSYEDLIVGAPLYTIPNNEGKYETGRIYVIYQVSEMGKFQKRSIRNGINSKSRFGLSVAGLGDINLDGYRDIAVGAPYDGEQGRGAVYIYHGGMNGLREKPSQIIQAEDVQYRTPIKTFGFSVAGGMDLDKNQYNDLIVGAYESDLAMLFRSRPVVTMVAEVEFISQTNSISLEDKKCPLPNNKRKKYPCVYLKYCLQYDGIGVDREVDFMLTINLDTKKPRDPRLFFLDAEMKSSMNTSIILNHNELYCSNITLYIMDNVRDKLTPLEVEIQYFLRSDLDGENIQLTRNPKAALLPILDQNTLNSKKAIINIQKDCGADDVCIPDLHLNAEANVKNYLLGTNENLIIHVIVENRGEDAFEASYNLQLPRGVNYVKIMQLGDLSIPVQCSPSHVNNTTTLKCDIGNPLPKESLVQFNVLLEPYYEHGMPLYYNLQMSANSTNPENPLFGNDNVQNMTVNIWVQTKFEIESHSTPPELHYNTSLYSGDNMTFEYDIGPQLIHVYKFKNTGASLIEKAEIFVAWPYETLAGDSLMYVLEEPKHSGAIECFPVEHINDYKLIIDPKKKSYLESSSYAFKSELKGSKADESGKVVTSSSGSLSSSGGAVNKMGGGSNSAESKSWSYSSKNVSWSSSSGGITEDQKRRLDEEERSSSKGDGSNVHAQRAQVAHENGVIVNKGQASSEGSKHWSFSSSQGQQSSSDATISKNKNVQWASQGGDQKYVGGETKYVNRFNEENVNEDNVYKNQGSSGASIERTTGDQSRERVFINKGGQEGHVYGGSQEGRWTSKEQSQNVGAGQNSKESYWITYTSKPTLYNQTYVRRWNSSRSGSGPTIVYHSNKNYTSMEGSSGEDKYETSTEYYTVGREGEPGSSFSNRISAGNTIDSTHSSRVSGHRRTGYDQDLGTYYGQEGDQSQGQGQGSVRYGAGSYTSGGGRHYKLGDRRIYFNNGSTASSQENRNVGAEGHATGTRHKWSTEETVNKNIINSGNQLHTEGLRQGLAAGTYSNSHEEGLGAIAAGKGFTVSTWDLGQINTDGNSRSSANENSMDSSRMHVTNSNQDGQQWRSSDGSQSAYQTQYKNTYQRQWGSDSLQSGDNVPTSKPLQHFRWEKRSSRERRELTPEENNENQLREAMKCSGLRCAVLRCIAGPLAANQEVLVGIRSRVNVQTLQKLAPEKNVTITSVGVIRVLELPYIGTPVERTPLAQQAVTNLIPFASLQPAEPVPLWVVVLSACVGTALLLLLIYGLYKCHFFERNRPVGPERQPLRDEQL